MTQVQHNQVILIDGNGDGIFDINNSADQVQDRHGNALSASQALALDESLKDRFYFVDSTGRWLGENNSLGLAQTTMGFSGPAQISSNAQTASRFHSGVIMSVVAGGALLWWGVKNFIKIDTEDGDKSEKPTPDVFAVPESDYVIYASADDGDAEEVEGDDDDGADGRSIDDIIDDLLTEGEFNLPRTESHLEIIRQIIRYAAAQRDKIDIIQRLIYQLVRPNTSLHLPNQFDDIVELARYSDDVYDRLLEKARMFKEEGNIEEALAAYYGALNFSPAKENMDEVLFEVLDMLYPSRSYLDIKAMFEFYAEYESLVFMLDGSIKITTLLPLIATGNAIPRDLASAESRIYLLGHLLMSSSGHENRIEALLTIAADIQINSADRIGYLQSLAPRPDAVLELRKHSLIATSLAGLRARYGKTIGSDSSELMGLYDLAGYGLLWGTNTASIIQYLSELKVKLNAMGYRSIAQKCDPLLRRLEATGASKDWHLDLYRTPLSREIEALLYVMRFNEGMIDYGTGTIETQNMKDGLVRNGRAFLSQVEDRSLKRQLRRVVRSIQRLPVRGQ